MISIILLTVCDVWSQNEYLNFIEEACFYDPDNLATDWIVDDIVSSDQALKPPTLSQQVHVLGIASSGFKFGAKEMSSRFRITAKNRKLKMSFLAQKSHQTAGLELNPIPDRVKILFGDFGFDYGLGLVMSSKKRFSSWLQDPNQLLFRDRGLRVNSSSDTSRFLRGAGISYDTGSFVLQAFFADKAEGIFLSYKSDRIHTGIGLSEFNFKNQIYSRFGPYIKCRVRGGILFGELALQSNMGNAFNIGYSFFGDERHTFIIKYLYYSIGFIPEFSVLKFSKTALSDERSMMINYKWEWRRDWILHADIQSESGFALPKGGVSPDEEWSLKVGLLRRLSTGNQLLARVVGAESGVRAMARWRVGLDKNDSYFQFESGWSGISNDQERDSKNFYFGFDLCKKFPVDMCVINTGLCLHQSSEKAPLLYRYEPDLFYSMSIPILSGSGIRAYLKFKYKLDKNFQIEFKYNRSLSYGDADESISNQIKLQIIYSPELSFGSY